MTDPNEDLIGFEWEEPGDPPVTWRVIGTDKMLGANYVECRRPVNTTATGYVSRIANSGVVRRHKQLTERA